MIRMRARIYKIFLPLLALIFLFSLISCNNSEAQATIADLEQRLADCEEKEAKAEETTTKATEKEITQEKTKTEETPIEEVKKEFSPVIVSNFFTQGYPRATFIVDNYLYAAGQGISIIDITDKSNPKLMGVTTNDWLGGIYVEGDYAFAIYSRWDNETGTSKGGLKVIDISDKESPVEIGDFSMEGNIFDLAVSGNYAFISYAIYGQQTSESGVEILDITDKTNPISIGNLSGGRSGGPFYVADDLGYYFPGGNLKIIDLKDINNVTEIDNYFFSVYANQLLADQEYLYFIVSNTLQIANLSDTNLEIIGGIFSRGNIQRVAIESDYAYVTYLINDSSSDNWVIKESGLQVIDLSNKIQPFIAARIDIPGEANGVSIQDNYAYVAAGPTGVHIVKLFDE